MNLELATKTVELLNDNDFIAEVYENYSGRGMYGSTVPGITTNASGAVVGFHLAMAVLYLKEQSGGEIEAIEALYEEVRKIPTRSDSLGLDAIYY